MSAAFCFTIAVKIKMPRRPVNRKRTAAFGPERRGPRETMMMVKPL
jgi:hypothetical protein